MSVIAKCWRSLFKIQGIHELLRSVFEHNAMDAVVVATALLDAYMCAMMKALLSHGCFREVLALYDQYVHLGKDDEVSHSVALQAAETRDAGRVRSIRATRSC